MKNHLKYLWILLPILLIAAMPARWNPSQFMAQGGYLSHTNGGNLGTNMTVGDQVNITNANGANLIFQMNELSSSSITVLTNGNAAWNLAFDATGFQFQTFDFFPALTINQNKTAEFAGAALFSSTISVTDISTFTGTTTHNGGAEVPVDRNLNIGNQTVMNTGSGSAASTTWTGEGNVTINTETFTVSSPATFNSTVSISTNLLGQSFNVQTTDATATAIASFSMPSDSAVTIQALVTGLQTDGSNGAGYRRSAVGKNNSGTTAIIGSVDTAFGGEDIAGWNCTITFDDGTDTANVIVTGAAATTVNWSALVTITWVRNP